MNDESLPLAYDTTSEYMGFNHLAHIKGEKVSNAVVYPATPAPADFSLTIDFLTLYVLHLPN